MNKGVTWWNKSLYSVLFDMNNHIKFSDTYNVWHQSEERCSRNIPCLKQSWKRLKKIPYCIKEGVRLPPMWKEINDTTLETHFNLLLTLFSGSNFLKMLTVLSLPIDSIIFDLAWVWANLTCHKISFHS